MEERIDQRIVVGRVFEEQQGQRAGVAQAQAGGVLVDLVVQLAGDAHALAGLGVDHRAAAQGPRHGWLGDPGQVGDVEEVALPLIVMGTRGDRGRCPGMMPWGGCRPSWPSLLVATVAVVRRSTP